MPLAFQVGVAEQHQVVVKFNKVWGYLSIAVDGRKVVSTIRVGSISLVKTYDFVVGVNEPHQVRVEKHREQFFGGFRPHKFFAFVDGQLVAQGVV
jgi:hypothetical protein